MPIEEGTAAMFTNKLTIIHTDENGVAIPRTITRSGPGSLKKDVVINDAVSNQALTIAFNYADLEMFEIVSDRDITLKTNSSGSPTQTISLVAGVPLVWFTGAPWSNPFTANVTAMYLTNASGQQANVLMRYLLKV